MTDTVARFRSGKIIFETVVDLENAIKLKHGENVDINDVIRDVAVYTDQKKGMRAGNAELKNVFGTTELQKVVEQIVKKGNIEVIQEFRDEKLEAKRKQVIDFLSRNAIDVRTGRPFTPDIIEKAIKEAKVNVQDKPLERQMPDIIEKLKKIIPLKIETKRIKVRIPSLYTGRVYGLIQEHKEKEEWFSNGDLEVILSIPVGMLMDFYDKLNAVTHGSALTEEMK
ncbi:ribosome assembly factor SBDS [Candidatus Pacearchaeota archaeon]|nr:ribosome assembly factor SBDS [Candidatus Pacearchaeota archaeon]